MRKLKNILVTGGAGFIGSNFIHYLFKMSPSGSDQFNDSDFKGNVINVDSLTYAANLESLKDVEAKFGNKRYFFEKCDICDKKRIEEIFYKYNIDTVVNFAAETHVDRSIYNSDDFIKTNVLGTHNLLEVAKDFWKIEQENPRNDVLFHHISTDEVYGSLEKEGYFFETTPYNPKNPYAATKASSDHIVMSYFNTYGLPVTISNCSNNYGPFQFPEKLIPLMIMNIKNQKSLPIYGKGENIRDWIYVEDHCRGIWQILNKSKAGEKWNIGGNNEIQNIHLLNMLIEIVSKELKIDDAIIKKKIEFIKDRPGHDKRYAINCDKIKNHLNWIQKISFDEGLNKTVKWYLSNWDWIENINSGEYRKWIKKNYTER